MSEVRLLRPREAAEIVGVRKETIYAWIASGELRRYDVGNGEKEPRWRISKDDLDDFMHRRAQRARLLRDTKRANKG